VTASSSLLSWLPLPSFSRSMYSIAASSLRSAMGMPFRVFRNRNNSLFRLEAGLSLYGRLGLVELVWLWGEGVGFLLFLAKGLSSPPSLYPESRGGLAAKSGNRGVSRAVCVEQLNRAGKEGGVNAETAKLVSASMMICTMQRKMNATENVGRPSDDGLTCRFEEEASRFMFSLCESCSFV
jgi:hypothetical protein